jgi:hypothetical protein
MNETIGRLLAVGNVAEVFEWGSRVVKLYKSTAAKPTAFREAAIHAAVETMGLPVPKVWSVQEIGVGAGGTALHAPKRPSRSHAETRLSPTKGVIQDQTRTSVEAPTRLGVGFGFRKETIAGMRRNGRVFGLLDLDLRICLASNGVGAGSGGLSRHRRCCSVGGLGEPNARGVGSLRCGVSSRPSWRRGSSI